MRDHVYVDETGYSTPIAQLPTAMIEERLREGVEIVDMSAFTGTVSGAEIAVHKRLELELFIRREGLR